MVAYKQNRDDMDKVVAYLLEKETITGAEMVAIIEGPDASSEDAPNAPSSGLETTPGEQPKDPQ